VGLPWLEAEFGWGESSAKSFTQVAELAATMPSFSDGVGQIDVSALYLLAHPSVPKAMRKAARDTCCIG
jgi:hypothetical protein